APRSAASRPREEGQRPQRAVIGRGSITRSLSAGDPEPSFSSSSSARGTATSSRPRTLFMVPQAKASARVAAAGRPAFRQPATGSVALQLRATRLAQ
ncbi:unnamed protein product, partial [Polarella glacialis]